MSGETSSRKISFWEKLIDCASHYGNSDSQRVVFEKHVDTRTHLGSCVVHISNFISNFTECTWACSTIATVSTGTLTAVTSICVCTDAILVTAVTICSTFIQVSTQKKNELNERIPNIDMTHWAGLAADRGPCQTLNIGVTHVFRWRFRLQYKLNFFVCVILRLVSGLG